METEALKALIKESVREVLQEERLLLMKSLIPTVNNEEMEEIADQGPDFFAEATIEDCLREMVNKS